MIPERKDWPETGFPDMNEEQLLDLMFILGGFFPGIAGLEMDHEGQLIAWLGDGPGQYCQPAILQLKLKVLDNQKDPSFVANATMPEVTP